MARTTSKSSYPVNSSSVHDAREALPELSMAILTVPVVSDDGRVLPAGSRGAIVFVHEGAAAYEVEFSRPFNAVLTVEARQLEGAGPA